MECNEYEKYKYISALDGALIDGKTYLVDRYDNSLYVIDEAKGKVSFKAHLGSDAKGCLSEFSFVLPHAGKLYILPQNSFCLVVYDIETEFFRKKMLPYEDEEWGFNVIDGFFMEGCLYIFSCMKKFAPLRIKVDSLEIEKLDSLWNELAALPQVDDLYYMDSFARKGDNIYFGIYGTNQLYTWSLQGNHLRKIADMTENFHIKKIAKCSKDVLLVSAIETNLVARIDLASQKIKVRYHRIIGWNDDIEAVRMLPCKSHIWIVPRIGTKVMKYDIETDSVSELLYDRECLPVDWQEDKRVFYGCSEHGGTLYLYRHGSNGRLIINIENGETVFQVLDKDENRDWMQIINENPQWYFDVDGAEENGIIGEGLYNLPLYINRISASKCKMDSELEDNTVGSIIWEKVRGDCK